MTQEHPKSFWHSFWDWYRLTSLMLGVPITFMLLVWGTSTATFTFTCELIGWRCQYAMGAEELVGRYMSNMLKQGKNVTVKEP